MNQRFDFTTTSLFFDGEIRALNDFTKEIGEHADSMDIEKWKDVIDTLRDVLGLKIPTSTAESTHSKIPWREILNLDGDQSTQVVESIIKDPSHPHHERVMELYAWIIKLVRSIPSHGGFVRRGLLSSLTTTFEVLITRLLHEYYTRYPGALKAEDRTLTLADLRDCGSIPAAEQLLVQKEIDSLLFRPTDELLPMVLKRFVFPPGLLSSSEAVLHEVFLRRNLFVHNVGIVNRHYLNKVPRDLYPEGLPAEGTTLPLTAEYLSNAFSHILVAGVVLVQSAWRKWDSAESDKAGGLLTYHVYESLRDREFDTVIRLTDFGLNLKGLRDDLRRVLLVNRAIAFREQNNTQAVAETLRTADWSSTSLRFQTAVSFLDGRIDQGFEFLRKAVLIKEVSGRDLATWPLFDPIRAHPTFKEISGGD